MDHGAILRDAVTYRLVMDALTHAGPAKARRLAADVCAQTTMPDSGDPPPDLGSTAAWTDGKIVYREPPLKPYAR